MVVIASALAAVLHEGVGRCAAMFPRNSPAITFISAPGYWVDDGTLVNLIAGAGALLALRDLGDRATCATSAGFLPHSICFPERAISCFQGFSDSATG